MPEYELAIDLSVKGKRRGLLAAIDCVHPVRDAPANPIEPEPIGEELSLLTTQGQVYEYVTCEWLSTFAIANRASYSYETTRRALTRLARYGWVERQIPSTRAMGKASQQTWRRAR